MLWLQSKKKGGYNMEELKETPLYKQHVDHGGKLIDFAGWALPVQYEGLVVEHEAVRKQAGLFDVSHMGEVYIEGEDAEKFINYMITNDVTKIEETQVLYTPMCYESGGIVDDLLVYKYSTTKYLLVINASNTDKDIAWLFHHSKAFNVRIIDVSLDVAQLALQGPKAQEILQPLVDFSLDDLKFYYFKENVKIGKYKVILSRTGYTGEDGFEIYADIKSAGEIWQLLMIGGESHGLKPAGLGARDTLRFEASLPLYGNELSKDITPYEAGIGMFVKLDKGDFMGKKVLAKQKEEGLERKIIGFELDKKGVTRHGYEVFNEEDEQIGVVTTGYYLKSSNRSIGLALVDAKYSKLGTKLRIQIRKKFADAKVVSKRFMNKQYKK